MTLGSEEAGKKNGVVGGESFVGTVYTVMKDVVEVGEGDCGLSAQLSAVCAKKGMASHAFCHL